MKTTYALAIQRHGVGVGQPIAHAGDVTSRGRTRLVGCLDDIVRKAILDEDFVDSLVERRAHGVSVKKFRR